MRYALVDRATGTVENVVEWDGVTPYNPGDQYDLVAVKADDIQPSDDGGWELA